MAFDIEIVTSRSAFIHTNTPDPLIWRPAPEDVAATNALFQKLWDNNPIIRQGRFDYKLRTIFEDEKTIKFFIKDGVRRDDHLKTEGLGPLFYPVRQEFENKARVFHERTGKTDFITSCMPPVLELHEHDFEVETTSWLREYGAIVDGIRVAQRGDVQRIPPNVWHIGNAHDFSTMKGLFTSAYDPY